MRLVSSLLLLVGLLFGAFTVAAAHNDPEDQKLLEDRIKSLELQVGYLRSRESAVTAYVLQNEKRAAGLALVVQRAREAGFEAASIPYGSRQILLRGLEALAASLRENLPAPTRADDVLLKQIGAYVAGR